MLRLIACIAALLFAAPTLAASTSIDVGFSTGLKPVGSPSVYTVNSNFTLPGGFSNPSLTISSMDVDDRGVLQLNGNTISSAGIFGPGLGAMTFTSGGPNNPFTFAFANGTENLVVTTGFLTGLNTLQLIVNDTNTGIFGAPLASGVNISSAALVATVRFDTAVVGAVPEPSTLALLGMSLFGLAGAKRRKVV